MTSEPIYEALLHHGEQDIDGIRRVWDDITGRFYHHNETVAPAVSSAPTGKQEAMNLTEIYDRIKTDVEADAAKVKDYTEQHLPALAAFAQAAAANPLVDAALNVLHLSPQYLTDIAAALQAADAKLGAAKQAEADAQAAQDAALAAAQPPPDAPPAEVPAA